jgi:hypothetical protein
MATLDLVQQRIEWSVYAEPMELFSLIINLVTELARLARTLVADGMGFISLLARTRTALIADNQ